MKLSGKGNRIWLVVGSSRCGVTISKGPWIKGVNPDTIKIRAKRGMFPPRMRDKLLVENNSDIMTDYFESDSVRLLPGHPLYESAKAIN